MAVAVPVPVVPVPVVPEPVPLDPLPPLEESELLPPDPLPPLEESDPLPESSESLLELCVLVVNVIVVPFSALEVMDW